MENEYPASTQITSKRELRAERIESGEFISRGKAGNERADEEVKR
jgi:hypothetical protein